MSKLLKLASLIPMDELEEAAKQQIYEALDKEFLIKLAVMPDCHAGYDLPIGGVALLDKVVSPSYVGYDIGCGMCFFETEIIASDLTLGMRQNIWNEIKVRVPNGEGGERARPKEYKQFPNTSGSKELSQKVQAKIESQLGTLGGGNHFIEIGENSSGHVCVTIHSGSRNPGHSVGGHFMVLATKEDTDLPEGFLHLHSGFGQAYLTDMNFMLEFALANRRDMMKTVLDVLGITDSHGPSFDKILDEGMINENHNHAVIWRDGESVLHRKGATPAMDGQFGIIPGNMRDGVYLTVGLGNPDYLYSASHGAGRAMSRKKAKSTISRDVFVEQMDGIISSTSNAMLDEAPDAYKDIAYVIKLQEGVVVRVLDYIKPIINVKGEGRPKPWEK